MCREYILNKVGVRNRKPNYKILLSATSAKEMVLHGHNFIFLSVILLISPWLTCLNWTHPDLVLLLMSLGVHTCVLSRVWLFVTLQTVACQAPLSMGFSRQEYWSALTEAILWGAISQYQSRLICWHHGFLEEAVLPAVTLQHGNSLEVSVPCR